MNHKLTSLLLALLALSFQPAFGASVGTAFTYQGRLSSGTNAATGLYDLTFSVWSASTGATQVGNTLTNTAAGVTNGLFTVTLDFGSAVFDGNARWLEVGVRTSGSGSFLTLAPRQALAATPYAQYAPGAGVASTVVAGGVTTAMLANGIITPNSDRNAKTDFAPVDPAAVLDCVAKLPIQQWRFKAESAGVKHVGPMAQDFRTAFGLGENPTAIATVDADGVALAAIQGLNRKLDERDAQVQALRQQNESLEQRLKSLELLIPFIIEKN